MTAPRTRRLSASARPPAGRPAWAAVAWLVAPAVIAASATWLVLRRPAAPAPRPALETPVPAPSDSPFFDEIARLEREGKFGDALRRLDEFSPRLDPDPNAGLRAEALRDVLERKGRALQAARVEEARRLAGQGKLREAVDRLADVAALGAAPRLAPLVTESYQQLRRAAEEHLAVRRRASLEAAEKEISRARKPAPASERFAQDDFAGVLAAARAAPLIDPELLLLLSMCATRAPLDEAVVRVYEEALRKNPQDRAVWLALCILHTWRQDAEAAAEVVRRVEQLKVKLDHPTIRAMDIYRKLRIRGLPPGKAVSVDYAGPYEIVTDAGPAQARRLAGQLEGIDREYAARFPWSRNPNLLMRVLYFEVHADFQEYCRDFYGQKRPDVAAFYLPATKQLVVSDLGEESHRVLRHEAFHQWLDFFAPQAPSWLHEGMASFMERSVEGKAAFDEQYHEWSLMGMKTHPTIPALLAMSQAEWHEHVPSPALLYGQSWSFIYFLHRRGKGALLDDFLRHLASGRSAPLATSLAFGTADLGALEREWKQAVLANAYDQRGPR
jgi:hypothetical protein